MTVIALKRNPLEMPQSCLVLTAKPRKSAKLEERFSQSREQAPGASRPASNRSDSVTLQLAFLKSSLSSHVRCLIEQREAPVLILVPRRSICASYLMTQFTQKSNQRFQEEKKKTRKLAKFASFHFLQRTISPQNCQPSAGPKAPDNRARTGSENISTSQMKHG